MKRPLLDLMCCLALDAQAGEQAPSTGNRVNSDAKDFGSSVAKATKDVGKQIGMGTKKTINNIKTKAKDDVKQDTPGDGSAKHRNEKLDTAMSGRQ